MKKIFTAALLFLLSSVLSAQTGSVNIAPNSLPVGAYHPVINIEYKPGLTAGFTTGALEIQFPTSFLPSPSTSNNNISAVIMAGGTTISAVNAANITTNGYAITITALTLSTDQEIVVTYGNSGAGGIYGPMTPGKYVFETSEKRDSVSSFVPLDNQPVLYVTYITLDKTSPSAYVKSGDIVTYYLDYKNLDSGNTLGSTEIWDTLPAKITYLSSQPQATTVNENYIFWDIGLVSPSEAARITVVAQANPGIIGLGDNCVNYASISAIHPGNGRNIMESKKELQVRGVKLTTSLVANPTDITTLQNITLIMAITNSGNITAINVSGTVQTISDGGTAQLYVNPYPYYVSSLVAKSTVNFTWIYKGISAGAVHFYGNARSSESTLLVTSLSAVSNNVNIIDPTPTYTQTHAVTGVNTETPTGTSTPQPAINDTATATATATTATIISATPVLTVTPVTEAPIPEKVRTDRNYINLTTGDKVEIKYTVESQGKSYIRIYNLNGEEIRGFYEFTLAPGTYSAYWDGTNNSGKKVGKGIYFIAVTQPGGRTIKKIIITK